MKDSRWLADAAFAAAIAIAVGAFAALAVHRLDPRFFDPASGADTWFEGDLPRITAEITHRWLPQTRAPVHPIFSLLAVVFVYALRAAGAPPMAAVTALLAAGAGIWAALLYAALRLSALARVEALVFTALGTTSAAGLFWLTVPETFVFGSATMLFALVVVGLSEHRALAEHWFIVASAATLAVTVTNWMAGVAAVFATQPWRRATQVTVNGFAAVVLLWAVQRVIVPNADFFLNGSHEQRYLLRPETGGLAANARVLALDSMVMPSVETTVKRGRDVMTVQHAAAWAANPLRIVALALWLALLCVGAGGAVVSVRESRMALVVVAVLLGQVLLHLVYGTEIFLYTLNVLPWLVLLAAFGVRTRYRQFVVAGAVALVIVGGAVNVGEWRRARAFFEWGGIDRGRGRAEALHYNGTLTQPFAVQDVSPAGATGDAASRRARTSGLPVRLKPANGSG